jgi:hypothetical protein
MLMFDHGYGVHLQMRNTSLYLSVHDQLLSLPPLIALQATRNHHCVMHDSKTPFLHNTIWCSTGQKKKTKKPQRVTQYNGQKYEMCFNRTVAKGSSKTRLKREERNDNNNQEIYSSSKFLLEL